MDPYKVVEALQEALWLESSWHLRYEVMYEKYGLLLEKILGLCCEKKGGWMENNERKGSTLMS